jgi:predicted RNA-binding protein with PIN domain
VKRWVVDGMNVIGSRPTGWWHDRPGAMQQLVHELQALDEPVTVIFDGRPFPVQDPGDIVVVTSDAELARRVREHGAEVMGAKQFRERLEDA